MLLRYGILGCAAEALEAIKEHLMSEAKMVQACLHHHPFKAWKPYHLSVSLNEL